jgi:hypothetical protein
MSAPVPTRSASGWAAAARDCAHHGRRHGPVVPAPGAYAATGVGLGFLAATYIVVLRGSDTATVRHFGLSVGGLLEPEPIDVKRMLRDFAWLSAERCYALIFFPPFWLGHVFWWKPKLPFVPAAPSLGDDVLGNCW